MYVMSISCSVNDSLVLFYRSVSSLGIISGTGVVYNITLKLSHSFSVLQM